MSRRQLTSKQHSFLEFLKNHVAEHKVWPTYREIVDHFDYRSPNSVTQNLQALTKKGFLRRDHNGYHLVDRQSDDGSIAVRGTLRGDQLDVSSTDRLSLSTFFPGMRGLHALRLDEPVARTRELGQAQYVLLADEEVEAGSTAVVLYEGRLSLRRLTADGRLEDPEGEAPPLPLCDARVLGRYAGHAGPYGIVRHGATQTAPLAAVSFA